MFRFGAQRTSVILAISAATISVTSSAQDEDTFDRTPVECISTSAIDRTDVIDDRTILFFMRGNRVYRNYLPRRCPGLDREERFSYKVTSSRLCDIDVVTVLEQFGGRLDRGFTCGLGMFHPIPPEEVEELTLGAEEGPPRRAPVDVEVVELPPEETDAVSEAPEEDVRPADRSRRRRR